MTSAAVARWRALGTTASVAVTDERALADARRAVQHELDAIDVACSRFRADSMLTRLNGAPGRWVRVGALLAEAITVALRAAAVTDGAVDPTVGRALIAAGYDGDFDAGLSAPVTRVATAPAPGWQVVSVDVEHARARIPDGVRLDLGATAKALAADRAAAAAASACADCGVLVNLGGDIAIAGPVPPGGWPVRVTDDHRDADDPGAQHVRIGGGGLATSSTTVRRWGPDAHHIVDPATGRPSASRWRTVSVAAASCVDANVASTAGIVFGEDAPAWLSARALPARLVAHDGAVTGVAGWPPQDGGR